MKLWKAGLGNGCSHSSGVKDKVAVAKPEDFAEFEIHFFFALRTNFVLLKKPVQNEVTQCPFISGQNNLISLYWKGKCRGSQVVVSESV